jgi:hypothetical protein
MPERENLDLLAPVTTHQQDQEAEDTAEDEVEEGPEHGQPGWLHLHRAQAINLQARATDPVSAPHTVAVVVIGVLGKDMTQMPLPGDQHPVGALAADAADPPFGDPVRTRRPDRCGDDLDADRGEDRVEGHRELGISIPR